MRERFLELLASLGIGQNTFEKKVGWSTGTINKMKHAPRADQLEGVIREFPTLNIKWLITGVGEMWDIPAPKASQTTGTSEDTISWLKARIEAQERVINTLSKVSNE